jgi:hypothetical protein
MADEGLGRLERIIDLRSVWAGEATNFTPWLARPENLALIGETLGLDLELEASERAVGPFRADILCKDCLTQAWVLIENQLERTDHIHLGQLLTYAAGLDAVTIVWVAARFADEHRATLDWLNRITDDSFRFFGVEIELWRIGTSPFAPRFNVVAQPNNWTRSVSRAARVIDGEVSERKLGQRDYWAAFHDELNVSSGPVLGNRTPQLQSWMTYSVGRAGYSLEASMTRKRELRAALYIDGENPKACFHQLRQEQAAIESEMGCQLEWEELPNKRASRVATYLRPANPEDQADWQRQHKWLAARVNDLHRCFARRVSTLGATVSAGMQPDLDTA